VTLREKPKFLLVSVVLLHRLVAAQGRDTSVRDVLFWGLKIQEIDDHSKIVQGYLVQGKILQGSIVLT
jgi:hypothetical protein